MPADRYILIQNGNYHTVRDTIDNKPLGVFEFKEDEFPVYFCFHKIIDLLNRFWSSTKELEQNNGVLAQENALLKEFLYTAMSGWISEVSSDTYGETERFRKVIDQGIEAIQRYMEEEID